MPHPESKSTPTFSDFPLLLAPWDGEIFKTEDHRLQKVRRAVRCAFADRLCWRSFVLNKLLVQIAFQGSEIFDPKHRWGPKKVPKIFFDADFGGFAGILRL